MATSNSTSWSLNRDQVITGALRKLAVIPSGGTPSAAQIADAKDALNALVKAFQADGMPLWKIREAEFMTVAGQSVYPVVASPSLPKPLKVLQADYTVAGGSNVNMNVMNRYDFNNLSSNSSTGAPIAFYYQPLRDSGTIYLWPTPSDSTTTITFQYQAPYEDMNSASDDFDFPSEWIMALIYNLAWVLSPEYGIPPNDRSSLAKEAQYWHEYVLSMGGEEGSIYFQPAT